MQTTKQKKTANCPLCLVPYVSVRQHCIKYHQMFNRKELRLVMNYTSGIHTGPLDCPICKCRGRVRLDKHLENVHGEIKMEHYKSIVKAAKQRATLFKLRYLRKSKPDPPMVSRLDLDNLSGSSEDEENEGEKEEEQQEEQQGGEGPSSNNPGSSASVSSPAVSCRKCSHLKQKVRHLESLLHSPVTTQTPQQTPVRPPDTPTPSRKKFERLKTKCKGPTPQLENVLNVWMSHIKGCNKRQEENARQRVTHVRNWLIFMADGGIPAVTLPFLQNKERLIEWVNSLKKHAVTTQLIQIGNVRGFIKFLLEAELPQVKVPKKHLHGTLFSLQALAKTARKELQTHRQAVRLKKSSSLVNPANITAFLTRANKEIPLALSTLEREKSREALERVYGLLSGLITCITGHRKGVVTNLKVEEFAEAEEDELERRIIRVKDHKTKESFGHALIPLMKTEYMWFYRLIYNRHKYPCGKSELVFSNSNGGPFNDILTAFQDCWESFGLPGRPTFSLIRSSISTCVGRSLEENKKGNIRRLMCHSTATAEKFYEADLGFNEAFQTRKDTAAALGSTFQNRCKTYKNTEKTDNTVSQSTEDGEGADKVESDNRKSSQKEKEINKVKKFVLRRSSEAVTRKDTAQAKRKKMAKSHEHDSDSEHTESRDSQSSQEEEEQAHKSKKHVMKRARVQSDNQRERRTDITLAKRKKTSKRRLQCSDTDCTESSDSKSSQEEKEAKKGKKRVMKRARAQSDNQMERGNDVTQAKRKMLKTRFPFSDSEYMASSDSKSSEGEGDGDEGHVQQEEVWECGTGKSDKRVTQDKDNDAERPIEIISSSEEIENVKKTTGEPVQQTVKHDKAKKRPRSSCNPVKSQRKMNNLSKSPTTKYSYLQRKRTGCSPKTPVNPRQLRLQSCHVVLQRVNTKALEELKRQRQARAKKRRSLQELRHLIGSAGKHKIKNKTGTTEDMTGNQKEDSHQVEVRAASREHHPADNAVRDAQAGDQEGDSNNSKLQNRDAEDSAAQGDKDNEIENGVAQAQGQEGDQGDGAEQREDQDGDPEEGALQVGDKEGDPDDGARQTGDQEGEPEGDAEQSGDREGDPQNSAVQAEDQKGGPEDCAKQADNQEGDAEDSAEQAGTRKGNTKAVALQVGDKEGDPDDGARQTGDQEGEPEGDAEQSGDREGDPQNSAVQAEDQKGGPEDCAKQADNQEGDAEDSAEQAGTRKGNTKAVALQVGDKEGDPDDGARQTGDQEGEPEGDAEQSGDREGDPQNSAVQAEDQKGGPEDCAKQADNQEGDAEDSAEQAGTRKGNTKAVALQVGDKEGDPDDGARQTGDQEGEPEGDAEQSGDREGDPQNSAVQAEDQKGGPEDCAKQADNQEGDAEDSAVKAGGTGTPTETKRSSLVTKKSPTVPKKVLGKYRHLMRTSLKRKKKAQQFFSPPQLRVRKLKSQPKET